MILENESGPVMNLGVASRPPVSTKMYLWSEINAEEARILQRLELQPGEKHTIELILNDYGNTPPGVAIGDWRRPDNRTRSVLARIWYGRVSRFLPLWP